MNDENLIPYNFRNMDADRHREISRKGGWASGIARRRKRERLEQAKEMVIAEKILHRDRFYMLHRDLAALRK